MAVSGVIVEQELGDFITADTHDVSFNINKKLKQMIREELETNIKSGLWDEDLPDSWLDDINIIVEGNLVRVDSKNEAIMAHEEGVESHPQTYLMGKVIPIEKDSEGNDQIIFRKCTMDSLMQGKFWHPGMAGKGFIEDAINTATDRLDELVEAAHKEDEKIYNNDTGEIL